MIIAGKDNPILNLIQKTPYLEALAEGLLDEGYPTISPNCGGNRFDKCRRLYDTLLQEFFSYDDERRDVLAKVFYLSNNAMAGDLLFSLKYSGKESVLETVAKLSEKEWNNLNIRTSSVSFARIFQFAKAGNSSTLNSLLLGVAAKCAGIEDNHFAKSLDSIDIERFKRKLGNTLLNSKDWMNRTLLHITAEGKSIECVEVVLQYAIEANQKSELLDSQDAFGRTPLHLAVQKYNVQMTKKMISEGSNLFIKSHTGEFPLQLIYQQLPSVVPYLLETAISICGDISSPKMFLHLDFSVVCTDVDFRQSDAERVWLSQGANDVTFMNSTITTVIDNESGHGQGSTLKTPEIQLGRPEKLEMTILHYVVSGQRDRPSQDILWHPVVQTFLDLKWRRMKVLLLTTYTALRVGIYGLYMLLMYQIYFVDCPLGSHCDVSDAHSKWALGAIPVVLIFLFIPSMHTVRKAAKFIPRYPGGQEFGNFRISGVINKAPRVLVNIMFYALVFGTCVPPLLGKPYEDYQYPLAIVGLLFSSLLILQVISNSNCTFGIQSIYIHVYGKVLLRFLSVIATFFPLLVACSVAFSIMYPNVKEFSTFSRSLFRLVIMLQGEFDFENTLYHNRTTANRKFQGNDDILFWSEQILFGVVGCVLSLVLIDVFLGYTISDINELQKKGEFVRRSNQVEQMFDAEEAIQVLDKFLMLLCPKRLWMVSDYFNLIPSRKKNANRNDILISFDEISEARKAQFRELLIET